MEGSETDSYVALMDAIIFVLVFGFPLVLILGALVVGRILEKKHFESIRTREAATFAYPAVPNPTIPEPSWDPSAIVADSRLVTASVVVSLDHFKKFLAHFRNIFGGNVRSYESLLDRGRREAILRLKERAPDCHIIVNLRLVTSNIASIHNRKKQVGGVEVLAFGTAVRYQCGPAIQRVRHVKIVLRDLGEAAEVNSGGGDRGLLKEVLTLGALTAISVVVIYFAVLLITEAIVAGISPQREQELFEHVAGGFFESKPVPKALQEKFSQCQQILEKLQSHEEVARINYRLVYIEELSPNAFAVPGGTIGVTRGLLNSLDEEIGFAFVLAHELGHFANRDHLRGLGRQLGFSAGARFLLGGDLDSFSRGTTELITAKYSRVHEAGADDFAIRCVLATYGETEGAEALFEVLEEQDTTPQWAYMFSTHPDNQSRIRRILEVRKRTVD